MSGFDPGLCDELGCVAAVIQWEDGSRHCVAGHVSRWVEREELQKAHARILRLENALRHIREAVDLGLLKKRGIGPKTHVEHVGAIPSFPKHLPVEEWPEQRECPMCGTTPFGPDCHSCAYDERTNGAKSYGAKS